MLISMTMVLMMYQIVGTSEPISFISGPPCYKDWRYCSVLTDGQVLTVTLNSHIFNYTHMYKTGIKFSKLRQKLFLKRKTKKDIEEEQEKKW